MEPEWHQDPQSKGIQPKSIPQFEVAGPQHDSEHRARAVRLVVSRLSLAGLCLAGLVILAMIPRALKSQSTFGQIKRPKTLVAPFDNKILITLHSVKRKQKVPGNLIFTSTAQDGFTFLICELSVTNMAEKKFPLNPFSFGIFTQDGKLYRADLTTNFYPNRIKRKNLKPNASIKGYVLFKIPVHQRAQSLELRGANGPITTIGM